VARNPFFTSMCRGQSPSTHAGIPWLRFIRQRHGARVHFWPFDGWGIADSRSAIVEVYPALWSRGFNREERTGDQHDAYSIAAWLRRADQDGSLARFFNPTLKNGGARISRSGGLDSRCGVSATSYETVGALGIELTTSPVWREKSLKKPFVFRSLSATRTIVCNESID
jgi:hypothetical protein